MGMFTFLGVWCLWGVLLRGAIFFAGGPLPHFSVNGPARDWIQ